jgi:acyl-coenzyme A thioesterase PaaI-like protein
MIKKVLKKQNNSKFCFACGIENDKGLHTEFYELEDGTIAATAIAQPFHRSYPGRVHGGVSSALLDETIGRAINIAEPDAWGVTVEIITRYKKPVPYDVPLLITGRITENKRLLFSGEGRIILPDGSTAVTASAKYMKMKLADIADFEADGDSWEQRLSEGDPTEFELPD